MIIYVNKQQKVSCQTDNSHYIPCKYEEVQLLISEEEEVKAIL